jgi:tetratricopeptide (TPR) repeat protein
LVKEGLLEVAPAEQVRLWSQETAYRLPSFALGRVLLGGEGAELGALRRRFSDLLWALEGEQRGCVEPLELLRWASLARQDERLAQDGPRVGAAYHKQGRLPLARRAWELALGGLERLEAARGVPEEAWEAVALQLVESYLDLDQPGEVEAMGQRMLERWSARSSLKPALDLVREEGEEIAPRLKQPQPVHEMLRLDWEHRLEVLPDKERPPVDEALGRLGHLLAGMALASLQRSEPAMAMARAWALVPLLRGAFPVKVWQRLCVTLARCLWRTSQRRPALRLLERVLEHAPLREAMSVEERADMLNLRAALLESQGELSQSQLREEYERVIHEYRQDPPPLAVIKAMDNLVRLFVMEGEYQVALYHVRKAIALVQDRGQPSMHYALLKSKADIFQHEGRVYSGWKTSEEAYRLALSTGRKDTEHRAALSLLYHCGELGLEGKSQEIYKSL